MKDYSRGKETAVDKIYEYIDGEIETLETDFETDNYADAGGGEKLEKINYRKHLFLGW